MSTLPAASRLANLAPTAPVSMPPFDVSYRSTVKTRSAVKTVLARMSGMLNALLHSHAERERAGQDAYLAKAVSMYDLERRMRALDRHDCRQPLRMTTDHSF